MSPPPPSIYNRVFWMSFIANAMMVGAHALTFRFAEFINYLGGTESLSGELVSCGVIFAIAGRLLLGPAIDHYGTRKVWTISGLVFILAAICLLATTQLSWQLYLTRILFSAGLAGVFSCSMVHIQAKVPPDRRTEIIASLGASGFLGMIAGTEISDLIFYLTSNGLLRYQLLFGGTVLLGMGYFLLVNSLTWGDEHLPPAQSVSPIRLARDYWPGTILLAAMLIGLNFTIISVFLTRFTTHVGIGRIGTFFLGYTTTAFSFRIIMRRFGDLFGMNNMTTVGLVSLGLGQFLFLIVGQDWHLLIPAVVTGLGHALLFPMVVSLGSGTFPPRYRGTGTTIVLGFMELGTVLSGPLLGYIVDYFGNGFREMFLFTGTISLLTALIFHFTARKEPLAVSDDPGILSEPLVVKKVG